ncbi:MAG: DUF433 domain-containing protein [Bacteroidetes bacterium]|jgi:uncharacterized protein (DUF433 family)|nr:DUF433 domain-containing protein [Bacteroidota bacterium]
MEWKNYIELNEDVLAGKPVIKGTRLSIEHIVNLFASGWSEQQIIENHPRLRKEDLQAVFLYIQDIIKDGLIYNEPQKSA